MFKAISRRTLASTAATAVASLLFAACSSSPAPVGTSGEAVGVYGDGHHDIVWQNFTYGNLNQGQAGTWHYDTASGSVGKYALSRFVGAGWTLRLDADFYGDGRTALLFQANDDNGMGPDQMFMLWDVNGQTVDDAPIIARMVPGNWTVVGAIDVDQDGKDDIVWQDQKTGNLGVWFMNGGAAPNRQTVVQYAGSPTTKALDVGYFNGTYPYVLLEDKPGGITRAVTLTPFGAAGSIFKVGSYPATAIRPTDTAWSEIGVGDVNRDGSSDVFFWNPTSGQIGIWIMANPGSITSYAYPGTAPSGWVPLQVADYDGDGVADVLWRNIHSTDVGIWRVAAGGNSTIATPDYGPSPCHWTIATLGTHGDVTLDCTNEGGPGLACYPGGSCDPTFDCVSGKCISQNVLGNVGQPCLPNNVCDDGRSVCRSGSCVPAGGLNQPCNAGLCNSPLACSEQTGTCQHCGGFNEPCCSMQSCSSGLACNPAGNTCIACGLQGEQCCPSSIVGIVYQSACGQNDQVLDKSLECVSNQCVLAPGLSGGGNPTVNGADLVLLDETIAPFPGETFTLPWGLVNEGNQTTKPGGYVVTVSFGPEGGEMSTVKTFNEPALAPGQSVGDQVDIMLPDDGHNYRALITVDPSHQVTNMASVAHLTQEYYLP